VVATSSIAIAASAKHTLNYSTSEAADRPALFKEWVPALPPSPSSCCEGGRGCLQLCQVIRRVCGQQALGCMLQGVLQGRLPVLTHSRRPAGVAVTRARLWGVLPQVLQWPTEQLLQARCGSWLRLQPLACLWVKQGPPR
jgi:hypothetical protein